MISFFNRNALLAIPFILSSACGTSTVDESAPEAPIVDASVPSVVVKCSVTDCVDEVTVFGVKQASVAVVEAVLGEVQALDESTEFSFAVTLEDGMNVFELRAQDNAGNKSKKTRVEILLAVRPDPIEITGPRIDSVFVWDQPSITWEGTKPANTGVYMVQEVAGERVVEALLVAPDASNTWSARANLQTTEDEGSNMNNFTFLAVTAQNVRSEPIQHQIDYDDVGCRVTMTNRTYDAAGELREIQPLEFSEESCTRTIDGEEQHGMCVWTSQLGGEAGSQFSIYPMIGVACEGASVNGTVDGGEVAEFRPALLVTTWSRDVTQACSSCDADDDVSETTAHVVLWASKEGRDTRKQNVWVTADFTPPTFANVVFNDSEGNVIPEDRETTSGTEIEVCGTSEGGAWVTLGNTDSGGESRGEIVGQADDAGAFCLTTEMAEGDNNLYLSAVDRARNRSAEEDNPARLLNVDNTGPAVTFITPRNNAWVNAGDTLVTIEAFDAYNGVGSVLAGIGDGEGVALVLGDDDTGRYAGQVAVPEEGARIEIWVVASDELGNETRETINVFRSGEPRILSSEADAWSSQVPRIGVGENGEIYAVWETCIADPSPCEAALVVASRLGGDGVWGDTIVLNLRNSANGSEPDVAVDENGLAHFVWVDDGRVGGREQQEVENIIYTTWDGTAPAISDATCTSIGAASQPQNPDNPGVCWRGLMQSQGGMGDVVSITAQGIAGGDASVPRIAAGSQGPAVVFAVNTVQENTGRAYEVYLALSVEGAWSPQILSDSTAGGEDGADKPDIAVDGSGAAHVVWEDDGNTDGDAENDADILYANVGSEANVLIANGHCGEVGNLTDFGDPVRGTSDPVVTVDPQDPNSRAFVAWLGEGGCGAGQNRAVRWAYTEDSSPFTSGNDGSGAYLGSAGDEFETARNRRPQVAVHSIEGDMTTQVFSLVWHSDASTRGSGTDFDILIRRYGRDFDGTGDAPAVSVITESRVGENTDEQSDYKPSVGVDPGGALHVVWEKRANSDDDKDVFYGVSAP
jgi:hypothetical protein